ncbi:MAG: acyl carrier protein [Pirellulales bacterium]|nr:acyl carrier protein [Pirellulales bacterium]
MSDWTSEQISTDVVTLLQNFPGREYPEAITPETRFFGDLGFRSIDAVVLGEMLEKHFGGSLPFHELLAVVNATGEQDLTVGQIVAFLERHLATSDSTAPQGC